MSKRNLVKLLVRLFGDPAHLEKVRKNPKRALASAGLTADERALLLSGSDAKLRAYLGSDAAKVVIQSKATSGGKAKVAAIKEPAKVAKIKEPVRLGKIKEPTKTAAIKEPTRVARIKEPVRLGKIKEPTRVAAIKEPTKVAAIKEPTKIAAIKEPTKIAAIKESTPTGSDSGGPDGTSQA